MYKKNPKIFILTIPIILQFVVGAILATFKFSNENVFNYQCDVHTVPVDGVYLGYVSTTPSKFTESTTPLFTTFCFCSISVILAHAALWLVTFAQRKVAGGHAAVVKLVVHEGAWIFVLLSGKKCLYCFHSWFLPSRLSDCCWNISLFIRVSRRKSIHYVWVPALPHNFFSAHRLTIGFLNSSLPTTMISIAVSTDSRLSPRNGFNPYPASVVQNHHEYAPPQGGAAL